MITKNQSLTIALRLRNLRICVKYAKSDGNNVFYSLPVVTKIQEKIGTNHITITKKDWIQSIPLIFELSDCNIEFQHMKKWTLLLKCMKEDVPLLANPLYL
jgi:hypothetical protein